VLSASLQVIVPVNLKYLGLHPKNGFPPTPPTKTFNVISFNVVQSLKHSFPSVSTFYKFIVGPKPIQPLKHYVPNVVTLVIVGNVVSLVQLWNVYAGILF